MAAAGGGGAAVSVLAPSGRRVTVRVGPGTVLLQVGSGRGRGRPAARRRGRGPARNASVLSADPRGGLQEAGRQPRRVRPEVSLSAPPGRVRDPPEAAPRRRRGRPWPLCWAGLDGARRGLPPLRACPRSGPALQRAPAGAGWAGAGGDGGPGAVGRGQAPLPQPVTQEGIVRGHPWERGIRRPDCASKVVLVT